MGHGAARAGLERQPGLTAIEGLDLALLVDRQHHRVGRRVHVEPADVAQLVGERRIAGALEGSNAMGLQAVRLPDPLHRAEPDTDRSGHRPAAPMGGFARRRGAGQRHHPFHRRAGQRRLAGDARLLAQQAVHTGFRKASLPAPHRRTADTGAPGHLEDRQPLGREQDDPSPQHVLVRAASITGDRGKTRAIFGVHKDADILSHAWRLARHLPPVNPFNGSVH